MPAEFSGVTNELSPKIRDILNMFEPMIFPSASEVFFFTAAAMDAASSGREVPHATSVSDMKASFTPHPRAMTMALSTKLSQLNIKTASPATTLRIAIQSGFSMDERFTYKSGSW